MICVQDAWIRPGVGASQNQRRSRRPQKCVDERGVVDLLFLFLFQASFVQACVVGKPVFAETN